MLKILSVNQSLTTVGPRSHPFYVVTQYINWSRLPGHTVYKGIDSLSSPIQPLAVQTTPLECDWSGKRYAQNTGFLLVQIGEVERQFQGI